MPKDNLSLENIPSINPQVKPDLVIPPVQAPNNTVLERQRLYKVLDGRELAGGGAQVKYYTPASEGEPGLRLFHQCDFKSQNPNLEIRSLEDMGRSNEFRFMVAELLPQLFLPTESLPGVPIIYGVGVYDPGQPLSSYYEMPAANSTVEEKYRLVDSVLKEWSKGKPGIQLFTLVEHIPHSREQSEPKLDTYCYPQQLASQEPEAYEKGLRAGLQFYLNSLQAGVWNFDLKDKEPFISKGGDIKILDTGGFKTVKGTAAEKSIANFCNGQFEEMERVLREQLSALGDNFLDVQVDTQRRDIFSALSQMNSAKLSLQDSLSELTKEVKFSSLGLLLERCYFNEFANAQKETPALNELKSCCEALSSGNTYWDAASPEELLEMFIIKLRIHHNQRIRLNAENSIQ